MRKPHDAFSYAVLLFGLAVIILFLYLEHTPFAFLISIPIILTIIISMLPKSVTDKSYFKSVKSLAEILNLATSKLFTINFFLAVGAYYLILSITLPNITFTRYLVLANIIIFEAITILPSFGNFLSKRKSKTISALTPFIDFYIVLLAFFYSSTIKSTDPLEAFSMLDMQVYPGVLVIILGAFLIGKFFYMEIYKKKRLKPYLDVMSWIIY